MTLTEYAAAVRAELVQIFADPHAGVYAGDDGSLQSMMDDELTPADAAAEIAYAVAS